MEKKGYNWKVAISISLFIAFATFITLMIVLGIIHSASGEDYITDKIVDCNDLDGDVMEDIVCHKTIFCSDILRFFNVKGCENFIEERGEE